VDLKEIARSVSTGACASQLRELPGQSLTSSRSGILFDQKYQRRDLPVESFEVLEIPFQQGSLQNGQKKTKYHHPLSVFSCKQTEF